MGTPTPGTVPMPANQAGHARRGVVWPQPAGLAEAVVERERRPRGQALRLPGGRVDDQLDRAVAAQVAVAEPGQPAVQPLAEARADLGPVQPGPVLAVGSSTNRVAWPGGAASGSSGEG